MRRRAEYAGKISKTPKDVPHLWDSVATELFIFTLD